MSSQPTATQDSQTMNPCPSILFRAKTPGDREKLLHILKTLGAHESEELSYELTRQELFGEPYHIAEQEYVVLCVFECRYVIYIIYTPFYTDLNYNYPEDGIPAKVIELLSKPVELPMKIGSYDVKFSEDGSIWVGCQHVRSELIDKIYETSQQKRQKEKVNPA